MSNKLCLGTVQFGLKYGIKNAIGRKPTPQEVFKILDCAVDNGIEYFDTASVYGNAEEILGEYQIGKRNVKVISKLKPAINADDVENAVRESLRYLNINAIDGYLLHDAKDFYRDGIISALTKCKELGLINNIGVSIYDPVDALNVVKGKCCDYVQIPYNVFDQRLDETDFFEIAQKNNVKVFARSAFLQGLLLMDDSHVPVNLHETIPHIKKFSKIVSTYGFTREEAAFLFSYYHTGIDFVVFGVDTVGQIKNNVKIVNKNNTYKECFKELKGCFKNIERRIIIPSEWSAG